MACHIRPVLAAPNCQMIKSYAELKHRLLNLNINTKGERRAPHKPLLVLFAISELLKGRSNLDYASVEKALEPLLNAYAPPVSNRHQPELPYWHLSTDGIWQMPGADKFPRQKGGFPTMKAIRGSSGHLTEDVSRLLLDNKDKVSQLVKALLDEHFSDSLHEDIVDAIGLDQALEYCENDENNSNTRKVRDPKFREMVLRAYEHRCAVTGFRAALGGSYFGCEAAHVQWHAYNGPDIVSNGIALEPTMHKLFDAGAWTLTDDRQIIISAEFTGTKSAVERLRKFHGQALREPLAGEQKVAQDFIRWHREADLGGVFRGPALRS